MDGFSNKYIVFYIQENVRLIYMNFYDFSKPQYQNVDWRDYSEDRVVLVELDKRMPYTSNFSKTEISHTKKEGFTPTTIPVFQNVSQLDSVIQNVSTVQRLQEQNVITHNQLLDQYDDLSQNIALTKDKMDFLIDNNAKYRYTDNDYDKDKYKDDPNVILRPEESNDIRWALQKDVTDLKIYQNSIYISTAIASATLLIAAIIISKG